MVVTLISLAEMVPMTVSLLVGVVVPMPTLPPTSTLRSTGSAEMLVLYPLAMTRKALRSPKLYTHTTGDAWFCPDTIPNPPAAMLVGFDPCGVLCAPITS